MNRLETKFLGVTLKNPVIAASGTFGFGREYNEFYDVGRLGGISSKGLTLQGKDGNTGIRIWETAAGIMNSIGLENPGVRGFIENELPAMRHYGCGVIVNLGGNTLDDYIKGVELLNDEQFDILELNISCPNVKEGGMAFGIRATDVENVTKRVKERCVHPLMVKLSPNAENVVDAAMAAQEGGADGVSLVNTFQAMAIDSRAKKAVFDNLYAGLSGPAIKPIALRMVHQVAKAVKIPVCGMGGIQSWQDALEFIMAGAAAVQVGTGNFHDMYAPLSIIEGLEKYCEEENLQNISEVRGII